MQAHEFSAFGTNCKIPCSSVIGSRAQCCKCRETALTAIRTLHECANEFCTRRKLSNDSLLRRQKSFQQQYCDNWTNALQIWLSSDARVPRRMPGWREIPYFDVNNDGRRRNWGPVWQRRGPVFSTRSSIDSIQGSAVKRTVERSLRLKSNRSATTVLTAQCVKFNVNGMLISTVEKEQCCADEVQGEMWVQRGRGFRAGASWDAPRVRDCKRTMLADPEIVNSLLGCNEAV